MGERPRMYKRSENLSIETCRAICRQERYTNYDTAHVIPIGFEHCTNCVSELYSPRDVSLLEKLTARSLDSLRIEHYGGRGPSLGAVVVWASGQGCRVRGARSTAGNDGAPFASRLWRLAKRRALLVCAGEKSAMSTANG